MVLKQPRNGRTLQASTSFPHVPHHGEASLAVIADFSVAAKPYVKVTPCFTTAVVSIGSFEIPRKYGLACLSTVVRITSTCFDVFPLSSCTVQVTMRGQRCLPCTFQGPWNLYCNRSAYSGTHVQAPLCEVTFDGLSFATTYFVTAAVSSSNLSIDFFRHGLGGDSF